MAATGFTPIQLYRTSTASATPSAGNLADGELAINLTDEKLYFKNASGVVKLLASNAASATSGTSILYGNGSGGFSNVTIGSGISFSGGTLSATGSGGTVTSVALSGGTTGLTVSGSPVTTSGTMTLAGTLAIANGGTGANTLAGANIPVTNASNTFTAKQTFSGSSSALGAVLTDTAEVATVSATAATGTINYDVTTQSVIYYTSNAAANWTVNFRGSSGTSLNTLLATGESITVAFLVTQGATAYYNNTVQVDGTTSGVTMRWLGGAPTAGNASGIDSYRYLIIKTGSATYTILASVTQFKA